MSKQLTLKIEDEGYPSGLYRLARQPDPLYIEGSLEVLQSQTVAIIGTRSCTAWGMDQAFEIAKKMSEANMTVISGLARGIDTAAHLGALESGSTVAVLGSALNRVYPAENEALARRIPTSGALVSAYPSGTGPKRHHFLERNHIVAALSDAVLVVEAPQVSGALHTARLAHKFQIPTFALADPAAGEGNKHLINTAVAEPINDAEELLNYLLHPRPPRQMTFGFTSGIGATCP